MFPPDQVTNLYVGPLDFTPAGPPASMVDVANPDLAEFPKFGEALAAAKVVELGPGDGIFIPALWWHHVEGLSDFNALVNYWWQQSPDAGPGMACLAHGIMTISHLPEPQRQAWRELFDQYVFQLNGDPAEHIPEHARGILARSSVPIRQQIRKFLLHVLSR